MVENVESTIYKGVLADNGEIFKIQKEGYTMIIKDEETLKIFKDSIANNLIRLVDNGGKVKSKPKVEKYENNDILKTKEINLSNNYLLISIGAELKEIKTKNNSYICRFESDSGIRDYEYTAMIISNNINEVKEEAFEKHMIIEQRPLNYN